MRICTRKLMRHATQTRSIVSSDQYMRLLRAVAAIGRMCISPTKSNEIVGAWRYYMNYVSGEEERVAHEAYVRALWDDAPATIDPYGIWNSRVLYSPSSRIH
jgi:hypothetical protein